MTHSPLRLLLELDARSQRDRDQPPAFLHRRDRKFALTCQQQGREPGTVAPALWGQWWPFVTMLWLTWVLIPRLLLLALGIGLVHRRSRRLLTGHPATHALMYRMETPTLDTGNDHNDAADLPDTDTQAGLLALPDTNLLLCWGGAGEPELPGGLAGAGSEILHAGGRISLADDRATLADIANRLRRNPRPAVLVVTRSWEPPTGELDDFLTDACAQWPASVRIVLVPLSLDGQREPESHQLRQWLRFADRLDPERVGVSVPRLEWQDPYAASGAGS